MSVATVSAVIGVLFALLFVAGLICFMVSGWKYYNADYSEIFTPAFIVGIVLTIVGFFGAFITAVWFSCYQKKKGINL